MVTGVPPRAVGVDGLAAVEVGEVVVEHHHRAVDVQRRVDQLAVGVRHPAVFGGAERLDVEVDGGGGVVDDEVGGQGRLNFDRHGGLLSTAGGHYVPTVRRAESHRDAQTTENPAGSARAARQRQQHRSRPCRGARRRARPAPSPRSSTSSGMRDVDAGGARDVEAVDGELEDPGRQVVAQPDAEPADHRDQRVVDAGQIAEHPVAPVRRRSPRDRSPRSRPACLPRSMMSSAPASRRVVADLRVVVAGLVTSSRSAGVRR